MQTKKSGKIKNKILKGVPTSAAVSLLLMGIIIAVVFNLDPLYFNRLIEREEAVEAKGVFESYEFLYSGKTDSITEVRIYFSDREELYLNNYNYDMDEGLDTLKRGDKLQMLLHPNSDYIWEISANGTTVIEFDEVREIAAVDNILSSAILGGFGLVCALVGAVALIVRLLDKRGVKAK